MNTKFLLSLIFIFQCCSNFIVAQQKGFALGLMANNLPNEKVKEVVEISLPKKSYQKVYENVWFPRLYINRFKTKEEGKKAWLFFADLGYLKKNNETKATIYEINDTTFYNIFEVKKKRFIAEIGVTYRREYWRSKNEDWRIGGGYTAALYHYWSRENPLTTIAFPVKKNETCLDFRFEPYLTYRINPKLYFDLSIYRLLGVSMCYEKIVVFQPVAPLETSTNRMMNFDLNTFRFQRLGLQAALRYALKTEKPKRNYKTKRH